MKRMKHPLHGFHHAYDGNMEATMRANGWVDDEPTAPQTEAGDDHIATLKASISAGIQTLTEPRRRGPNKAK